MKHDIAVVLVLFVMLAALAAAKPFAPSEKPPSFKCQVECTSQWGPKLEECKDVKECRRYVESQYLNCVSECEKKENK